MITEKVFLSSVFDVHMHHTRNIFRNEINAKYNYILGKFCGNAYLYDFELGIPENTDAVSVLEICFDKIVNSTVFIFLLGNTYGSFVRNFVKDADYKDSPYAELIELGIREDLSVLELELVCALNKPDLEKFLFLDGSVYDTKNGNEKIDKLIERVWQYGLKFSVCKDTVEIKAQAVDRFIAFCGLKYGHLLTKTDYDKKNDNLFQANMSRYYIKNDENYAYLEEYCKGEDNRPLIIAGEEGIGKTSLLLQWSGEFAADHQEYTVVRQFVGNQYRDVSAVLEHIYRTVLGSEFDALKIENRISYEIGLINAFSIVASLAAQKSKKLLIIIDGFESFEYRSEYQGYFWIPPVLPPGIKVIVSMENIPDGKFDIFRPDSPKPELLLENILTLEGKEREYHKFSDQISRLNRGRLTPQYVRLVAGEIILTANYRSILSAVRFYLDDEIDMIMAYQNYLQRISCVFSAETVKNICRYLLLTSYGLEEEILFELVPNEDTEEFLYFMYHYFRRSIRNTVQFGDGYFRKAAEILFPLSTEEEREFRNQIVNILTAKRNGILGAMEVAHQLYHMKDQRITGVLANINIAHYMYFVNRMLLFEYMQLTQNVRELTEAWKKAVTTEKQFLFLTEVYYGTGNYKEALSRYMYRAQYNEQTHGETDIKTYNSYINMAELFTLLGEYDAAYGVYAKKLLPAVDAPAMTDEYRAQVYNGFGNVCSYLKDYDNALTAYKKAKLYYEKSRGETHPETAAAIQNIGRVLFGQGNYDEARQYFYQAEKSYRLSLGERHPYYLKVLNNISLLYSSMFEFEKALELEQYVLNTRREIMGEDHVETGKALMNIGTILGKMLELDKAEEYSEKALVIFKKGLGEQHPYTQDVYNNIESIKGDREFIKIMLQHINDDSASAFKYIGDECAQAGKFDIAESCYYKALSLYKAAGDYTGVGRVYYNVGITFSLTGRLSLAMYWHEAAYETRARELGMHHPETADSCMAIAEIYAKSGLYEESVEWNMRAIQICETLPGKEGISLAQAYNNVSMDFLNLAAYENAYFYIQKAYSMYYLNYGELHPKTVNAYNNIQRILQAVREDS